MNSLVTHSNQLAGHADHLFEGTDGKVLKRTNQIESKFYETLKGRNISEMIMNFFPQFYGTRILDGDNYVVLEDLTSGYEMPSIIDIKIGTSSEDPRDNEVKRMYMRHKDNTTTTKSLGIRICGLKNWNIKAKRFVKEGKQFGRNITSKNMKPALRMFFYDGVKVRTDVIEYLVSRIKCLLEWWEEGGDFSLISSSLLIIYDAKVKKDIKADVRMIDFAHFHEIEESEKDESYIVGLKSLIKIFREIVQDEISSGEQ